ncbi:LysR family transcriptional regulator [Chromobacterium sp. LK11]|uniref:LysR family transcriptional regulator n=1 Tax=Chromobacterium sp. LK11 TaxID=1628212 RepID=UPI000652E049|nr:LysR family transcriptional regulator [Chromobacterium sp. LK11]KMN83526.1 LysR family transcriptional regulator [Chromobacterium sp. LK11]
MLGNVSDLDLRLLRIFCSIVEAGGFTAAQAKLNTGLPRLSVAVRDLEQRLGYSLCRRGNGGFQLTPAGQALYQAAQGLLREIEQFREQANALGEPRREALYLGAVDGLLSLPRAPLPAVIRQFRRQWPQAQLHLHTMRPDELEQAVLEDRLQLGLGAFHHQLSGLRYQPLFSEEQNLYCSRQHPLFAVAAPSQQQICAADYVGRGYMAEHQRPQNWRLRQVVSAYSMEAIATLVLSGTYLGYLPTHYARHWVDAGRLRALLPEQLAYHSGFHAVTRQGAPLKPALARLLDMLIQAAQNVTEAGRATSDIEP